MRHNITIIVIINYKFCVTVTNVTFFNGVDYYEYHKVFLSVWKHSCLQ